MGYVRTNVTVLESDGVATLTVAFSMPPEDVPIETSFYLLVNTMDGSATEAGLPQSQTLLCVYPYTSLTHSNQLIARS